MQLLNLMRRVEKALLLFASVILIAIACLIFMDVIGRYFFNKPFGGAFELVAIGIALMTFAALPEATARNAHISVTLAKFLPRPVQKVLGITMASLTVLAFAVLGWRLFEHAVRMNSYGDYASFTGIPYAPVAATMALATLVSALCRAIRLVLVPHQSLIGLTEDQL